VGRTRIVQETGCGTSAVLDSGGGSPVPSPPRASTVWGGPLRLRSVLVGVTFAASAAVSFLLFDAGAGASAPAPGGSGDPSYDLSSFTVSAEAGTNEARVGFDMAWSTSTFPGKAPCEIDVLDSTGVSVGVLQFAAVSLERGPVANRSVPLDILPGSEPASATGACGAGSPPSQAARYLLSDVRIERTPSPRLRAVAAWKDGIAPGDQACTATLTLPGGTRATYPFTLSAPDGRQITVLLIPELASATNAEASCGPLGARAP
jgi:hypothetical protein